MKIRIVFTILGIGIFFSAQAFSVQVQMDTLLNRYQEYLLRTHQSEREKALQWSDLLNEQGQWADIDYDDKEPAGWKPALHLERIREMALAWTDPQSELYHDEALGETIDSALDHWLKKRYQSTNWWHNQIGTPRNIRDIIILLRDRLTPGRLQKSLEVMAQLNVAENFVGANLIWCADLGLHYGALTGDESLVSHCRGLILKEIKIHKGEGVQPDYSFHQHGSRLQMYQYGEAFLLEGVRIAWQLRETPWEFPDDKIDVLTGFALEGWQWMARGIHTVPSTMDRSATRVGELRAADLRPLIPFIIELQPEKAAAFKKMAAIQNGEGSLIGFRYYPRSDFAAYHRPGFSFFLKTISSRTYPTESINRENLKGKLLHSGDAYLIRNGEEYFDLMPVWDWTALPGITAFKGAYAIDRQGFVGSVSNGISGLSVMDYRLKEETGKQKLSAHKIWANHKDMIICLIADMKGEQIIDDVYTALDQSRWQGDVTINKPGNVIGYGSHKIKDVEWIHHAGFAYVPLQPTTFYLQLKEVSGTWASVNASIKQDTVSERIFMPVMLHDLKHRPSTGYAIVLCESPKNAKKIANKPSWEVLRNDKSCQAVQFKDGMLMVAFFSAGQLSIGKKEVLQVDQPCLIQIDEDKIFVSDPSHEGKAVKIAWKDQVFTKELPKGGLTVEVK